MRRIDRALALLDRRVRRHLTLSTAIGAGITFVVALVVIAPRFRVGGPSLIDDWTQIRYSPVAWDQLKHLSYDATIYDVGRFRPGFWGIWSQLQWHTLGAPGSMVGPNLWNLARIALFAFATAGIVVVALEWSGRRFGTGWTGLLAAAPGVLIVATPQIGVDFERLGPQEPLLFGGIGAGVLLLLITARAVADPERRIGPSAVLAAIAGALLFAFGVYIKEASVCLLVLLPFIPFGRVRDAFRTAPGGRRAALVVLGLAVAAPVLHMAGEIVHLYQQPQLVYGAEKPHGLGGTISRFTEVAWDQFRGIGDLTGSPLWQVLLVAVTIAVLAEVVRLRRIPRLHGALMLLAWALLVFQGMTAAIETRYFIPVVALVAIVAVLLVAEQPRKVQQWSLVVVALLVLVHARSAGAGTYGYADTDRASLRFIDSVAQLDPARCPVYRSRMDIETRFAVPEVLALRPGHPAGCTEGYDAVLVRGKDFGLASTDKQADAAVVAACAGGWKVIREIDRATVLGCPRLSAQPPKRARLKPERSPTADL